MSTEIKIVLKLKHGSTEELTLELKMSEAEDLYLKLKDIFDKPKKDIHNPLMPTYRGTNDPIFNPWHQPGTIPCHTGTPFKLDDMTITCRVDGSGVA